jgi:hypothetical protein
MVWGDKRLSLVKANRNGEEEIMKKITLFKATAYMLYIGIPFVQVLWGLRCPVPVVPKIQVGVPKVQGFF